MQECLGISITDNLIRYAKVQKTSTQIKVTAFGIKFYDNLKSSIDQIIKETDSLKTPISIDIKNEKYYYFNIFNLTNKDYAEKAITTEFESFCSENHINKNAYEGRYIYTRSLDNPDQSRVVYVYNNKSDINERTETFKNVRLESVTPITTTLPNLIKVEKGKNILIVNLEKNTSITTIINQSIYNVDIIQEGMGDILEKINEKENSYSKSYEVCKNTTIYTMETAIEDTTNTENLQYIVPVLYKVVEEIKRIKENYKKIDEIYLTGMGTVINNVDLYFKEYFRESKVEILKPFFIESQANINVKDYIEVNPAIALGMQGLDYGIKNLNFITSNFSKTFLSIKNLLNSDISNIKFSKPNFKFNFNLDLNLRGELDKIERIMIMDCIMILIITMIYGGASTILGKQIDSKISEADEVTLDTNKQIQLANTDDGKINTKTTDYQKYKTNLQNTSSTLETKNSRKNQITSLLNQIVYIIPKEVQLTEIKNTEVNSGGNTTEHITIYAQSTKYEQLAYFKAQMKSKNILNNITSTEGTKDGDTVRIAIEGDLKAY